MATVKIPEQKVILVGEYGVGKSSLFRRFTNNTFITATDRKSTLGLDHIGKVFFEEDHRVETTRTNNLGQNARSDNAESRKPLKLTLWDTGGMERVASITSSYYKYSEAAILVFALDNPDTFHILSQHLLDIVTYAENAKIFLCGNKFDLTSKICITDSDMDAFCEQCHNLVSGVYKTSCKTGDGVDEMFLDIAKQLAESNRSRMELQSLGEEARSFRIDEAKEVTEEPDCSC